MSGNKDTKVYTQIELRYHKTRDKILKKYEI